MLFAQDPVTDAAVEQVSFLVGRPVAVVAVLVGTWVLTRIARRVIHRSVRHMADRSLANPSSAWRFRAPRLFGETSEQAEARRRQRVDATSRMVSHLFALAAWLAAIVVVLHLFDISPVLLLSSAGFLGAGLAIGGQHAVRDYLAGLSILLEDRFGVGDRIAAESPTGQVIEGVVDHVGAFSTRLREGDATWHLANGSLGQVRNLSQLPATTRLEVPGDLTAGHVARVIERAAPNLTGVVLIDDVLAARPEGDPDGETVHVTLRTSRPLSAEHQERLRRLVQDELARQPA